MSDETSQEGETKQQDQATGEQELYAAHPTMFRNHPVAFVLCLLLLLAGVIGAPTAYYTLEEHTELATIGAAAVAVMVAIAMGRWWFRTLATKLRVTSQRTILRHGLLSKHINEISHGNIRNVQIKQNPIERLFSTGTVKIASAGQSSVEIEVEGLPHPEKIRELINKHRNG